MKIPLSWLKKYVRINTDPEEIARLLTLSGTEVTQITKLGSEWDKDLIIAAEVKSIEPHPNADRLALPTLDVGTSSNVTVVCGANNISVGQKVAFARAGANLYNPKSGNLEKLNPSKIRGVLSEGMVCSGLELGLNDAHEGILVLEDTYKPGTPLVDLLGDTILETDLTPNRPDCLSMMGNAYEIAALTQEPVTIPSCDYPTGEEDAASLISLEITDQNLCPRYTATVIKDIKVGPSPMWLQDTLSKAGQRPVNNVVDITNYVMLEQGQPLHAFDYDKIKNQRIVVRRAKSAETITTLDGHKRTLTGEMLVIADGDKPIGLAGIIGGKNTEINLNTSCIVLESANFNSSNIRSTRNSLGISTEASYRFERDIRPEIAPIALERATALITEYCGGRAANSIVDIWDKTPVDRQITVTKHRVQKVLGAEFSLAEVWKVLSHLGFQKKEAHSDVLNLVETLEGKPSTERYDLMHVVPPYWRSDLNIEDDVIEDFARIYGYDNLPSRKLASQLPNQVIDKSQVLKSTIRNNLVTAGMNEIISYAVSSYDNLDASGGIPLGIEPLKLANPMDAKVDRLRTSLRANLLTTLADNVKRSDSIKIFEIGHIFLPPVDDLDQSMPVEKEHIVGLVTGLRESNGLWSKDVEKMDFYDAKGIVEFCLSEFATELTFQKASDPALLQGRTASISLNGDTVGVLGELKPAVCAHMGLPNETISIFEIDLDLVSNNQSHRSIYYKTPSKYPTMERDITLLLNKEIPAERIVENIAKHKLVQRSYITDIYHDQNIDAEKKSATFRIIFQSMARTLSSKEIDKVQDKILRSLQQKLGVTVRHLL